MAAVFFALEEENRRALRRERVFRDRLHPFDEYDDVDLLKRYRMPRPVLMQVVDLLHDDVAHPTKRSHAVSASLQVLAAIRYYATGSFQLVSGDTVHLSQPTLSRIVTRVTDALARRARQFINFPFDDASLDRIKEGFYTDRHRIPNVLGVVDGSLVQIKAPSINEQAYVGRKGFHAINVQGVCTSDLKFTSIVSSWPGSTHDAFIWSNCELNRKLQRGAANDGFLLGDKAYPLRPWLLTPVRRPQTNSERRFNCHHQRARQKIEATFGKWKTRWLCLSKDGKFEHLYQILLNLRR